MGLREQLLLALVLPALLVIGLMAYFADGAAREALDIALGERLSGLAEAAATVVDPRVLLLEKGDDESRLAKSTQRRLRELAQATGVERVLVVSLDRGEVLIDSERALSIGAEYARARFDRVELEQVAAGRSTSSVLFRGVEGRWYKSGYAPLTEASENEGERGAVKAAVVVNAPAAFFETIDDLRRVLASIAIFGLVALGLLAAVSSRRVAVPLSELSQAAERIGAGDLETPIPKEGPREAAVLAETMRAMAANISARDKEMQIMLAGIAHEVRNPLGGIELFGGLLREDLEEGDPRRRHVEKILKEINVLAGVVNDFLDFARRTPIAPKPTLIAGLVDEVLAIASADADAKKIALRSRVDPKLCARADSASVSRALLNLVRNAVQATPEGGKIEVGACCEGEVVEISVSDTGPGIPEEQREAIFTPFYTTKQKGTGLGLALVSKAAKAHGGSIRVEEAEGGGARFVLALPASAELPAAEPGLIG